MIDFPLYDVQRRHQVSGEYKMPTKGTAERKTIVFLNFCGYLAETLSVPSGFFLSL